MATKIVFTRPGGGSGELETETPVNEIVSQVNRALKTSEKFITIIEADGKKRGLEAANVITIRDT